MRTGFFKAVAAAVVGFCLLAVSCKEPVKITPNFPENVITKLMKAGETLPIEFDANMDWTLKVSGEGAGSYFGIFDEGLLETSVSGGAGQQTVIVGFTEDVDFDLDRVCIVTLEMGGMSKEIANLTKIRGNRVLELYVAELDDFGFKQSGRAYVYGSEPVSELTLHTFPGQDTYSLPVKVVANFNWMLNTNSTFVNASVTESSAEETELLLTLTTDESLAAGETIALDFLTSAEADAAKYSVNLSIPAFGDRMEIDCASTLYFNAEGQLKMPVGSFADQPAICYVLAAKGARVRALEWNEAQGWYETSYAAWVHADMPFAADGAYIQPVTAQITVDANTDVQRYADIMILPASLANLGADELCNGEGTAIKPEYEQYLAGRLTQEGKTADFVNFDETITETYKATLEKNAAGTDWMKSQFGTDEIYTLTYTDPLSESALAFASSVASVEIYDYDCNRLSASAVETFWLEINLFQQGMKGRVYMYPDAYVASMGEKPESFIALLDAEGKTLALLDCVYSAGGSSTVGGETLTVVAGGATIEKLSSGDIYEGICGNFSVSEVYDITSSSASNMLRSTVAIGGYNIYDMTLTKVNDGSLSLEGASANDFYVFVGEKVTELTSWIVVLKDENSVNFTAFLFTYDPAAAGASEPVSFAYPDNVKNATISKYSGSLLSQIKAEHYGVDENVIYELKYSGEPQMALLNVPGVPYGEAAWNNFDEATYQPIPNYWLSYEMEGKNQMYVNMAETGKSDWFVWMDMATYKPILVLVCTAVAAN